MIELLEIGLSPEKAKAAIEALRGKVFVNRETGIAAGLSSSSKGKLVSNKAAGKSRANGFTSAQHNALAANIDSIYVAASLVSSRPDKDGDVNIVSIKRFKSEVSFGDKPAWAWITVKESKQHGHHIYSVEAIKLEALDRKVEVVSGNTPHASSAPTAKIISKVVGWFKGALSRQSSRRYSSRVEGVERCRGGGECERRVQ